MISNSGTSTLGLYDFKKQLDAFGGVDYFRSTLVGGYIPNSRVMLANGEIVQNSTNGNLTNNPNTDMTGWSKKGNLIIVDSISKLTSTNNPFDGLCAFVVSFHAGGLATTQPYIGGGDFYYDSTKSSTNNGITVFNGWVRVVENNSDLNVTWAGAKGDGIYDDTTAFNNAKNAAILASSNVYVPTPLVSYMITSTIIIDQKVSFKGECGTMIDKFAGKTTQGGSRIKYTGNAVAFQINPIFSPTSTQRRAYGVAFKDLIIEGTSSATHAIKVSDKTNINVSGADISAFTIDNVYLINFKSGRGLELNFCFNNTITNLYTGDCAVSVTLNYAHSTTFIGGSLQQGLVGLDAISSYDVTLHGTCLQGYSTTRGALVGLVMPSDFFIWTGAWNGTGADAVVRTTALDYAGIGCRVFGSIVSWHGGYEEANDIGYLQELGSSLSLYSKYVDLDATLKYWIQIGIGSLTVISPIFAQGGFTSLKGVFHTERNYAAPMCVVAPNFPQALPSTKRYTGRVVNNVGVLDSWDASTFRYTRKFYQTDIVTDGKITHSGLIAQGGFNREFRETISPASNVSGTLNLSTGTIGTNFLHLANGVNLTIDFTDSLRAQAGTSMKLVLINNSLSIPTVLSPSSNFKFGSATYTLPAKTQRVFEFYYDNGVWLEKGVSLLL